MGREVYHPATTIPGKKIYCPAPNSISAPTKKYISPQIVYQVRKYQIQEQSGWIFDKAAIHLSRYVISYNQTTENVKQKVEPTNLDSIKIVGSAVFGSNVGRVEA